MPKYGTQVIYEPKINESYDIVSVDEVTSKSGSQYIKVELKAKNPLDKRVYALNMWPSDETSSTSKWGAFVSTLGDNTDLWIAERIRIVAISKYALEIVKEKISKNKKENEE